MIPLQAHSFGSAQSKTAIHFRGSPSSPPPAMPPALFLFRTLTDLQTGETVVQLDCGRGRVATLRDERPRRSDDPIEQSLCRSP
ncbi:hypothetical protein P3T21_004139 [Paraburkholderia sp. GAS334]